MKIARVQPLLIGRFLFVEITTDAGLVGLGEAGAWAYLESVAAAVAKMGHYLTGKDPLLIEHHWQAIYRSSHFRGSVIMAALSAIDVALWDIAGKHFKAPVHALLGGKIRERARAYAGIYNKHVEKIVSEIARARSRGFTAVGHLSPFGGSEEKDPGAVSHVKMLSNAVEAVGAFRQAAGDAVDICIEVHRRLSPHEAVQFGRAIEPFTPLFLEDPVTPGNFDEMTYVASKVAVPLATGERLTSLWEFQMLLARGGAQLLRPDVGLVGGITGMRKIAALAEAAHVGLVPHSPLTAVSLAANLQIAATSPAFVVQEVPQDAWAADSNPNRRILDGVPDDDRAGFIPIGDGPGIGVALKRDAAQIFPYTPRTVEPQTRADGAVVDN